MASIRVRQRQDGSAYTSVLYVLEGKQTLSSFNDHKEAVGFQQFVNRVGPANAIEVWRSNGPPRTATPWLAGVVTTLTT